MNVISNVRRPCAVTVTCTEEVVSVTPAERASWGLTATSGALVVGVFPGAPATLAGIGVGDVIISFAGHAITTDVSLTVAVRTAHPGERVTVELYRRRTLMTISLVLGAKPAPELVAKGVDHVAAAIRAERDPGPVGRPGRLTHRGTPGVDKRGRARGCVHHPQPADLVVDEARPVGHRAETIDVVKVG